MGRFDQIRSDLHILCMRLSSVSGAPCMQEALSQGAPSGWAALTKLFPSASHLISSVQSTVSILRPLAGPKVAQVLRRGISDLFQTYTSALATSYQKHQQPDGSFPYHLGKLPGCLWYILDVVTLRWWSQSLLYCTLHCLVHI